MQIESQQQESAITKTTLNLNIAGYSLLTPLGNKAEQLFYAVQAGISAYTKSDQLNSIGTPMTKCLIPNDAIPGLHDDFLESALTGRQKRMLAIAGESLASLYTDLKIKKPLPIILAAPEKLPGFRTPIDDKFLSMLTKQADVKIDIENSYVIPEGRAASYKVINLAKTLMATKGIEYVIVGAIDSFHDSKLLAKLDLDQRVLAEGQVEGFAPGEGSCFILLSSTPVSKSSTNLHQYGEAFEPGHQYCDTPYTGEALSLACSKALIDAPAKSIKTLCGTLNGESYYGKEWGIAQLRNSQMLDVDISLLHPADCIGDLGAASGLVNLILICEGYKSGILNEDALLTASSELGARTALWVKSL